MSIAVVTAVADPRHEADLATCLQDPATGATLVRRCVELPDLIAAAAAGMAQVAIVSPDLRRLDRATVEQLVESQVAVVGVAADRAANAQLQRLGIARVIADVTSVEELATTLAAAAEDRKRDPTLDQILDWSGAPEPWAVIVEPRAADESRADAGRVIAVWGPTGAPGRTTLAVNLAAELADLGREVLLIDADCYGGVVAQVLGLLDETAAIATACRAANAGTLDPDTLSGLTVEVRPGLRVLTGISRADRWAELRPGALEIVLTRARSLADEVVVDCGFCLEQDEELSYDTAAPRRNGSTLAVLSAAEVVLAVAAADPVGLTRCVRALGELRTVLPQVTPTTVVNRVRPRVVGSGDPAGQIAAALARHAGVERMVAVPDDPESYDAALAVGRLLAEVAPGSSARAAIHALARELAGLAAPRRRGVLARLRG